MERDVNVTELSKVAADFKGTTFRYSDHGLFVNRHILLLESFMWRGIGKHLEQQGGTLWQHLLSVPPPPREAFPCILMAFVRLLAHSRDEMNEYEFADQYDRAMAAYLLAEEARSDVFDYEDDVE